MIVSNTSPRSIAQTTRLGFGLCALVFMTACGGGGGGDTAVETTPKFTKPIGDTDTSKPATPGGVETGAQMRSGASVLIDKYDDPIIYTTLSTIPTTASADYDGYFYGDLSNTTDDVTDTLIGTMSMRVVFAANAVTVSGSVTDFTDEYNNAVTGSLELSDGRFYRDGNPSSDATFRPAFEGDLTDDDGRLLGLSGSLEGDFLTTNYKAVGGAATGRIEGSFAQDFDGGFIAER